MRAAACRLVAAAVIALLLAACAHDEDQRSALADDPGPVHVHGLGINPSDGALFVAAHSGVFRVPPEGGAAERVGELLQDTMGFTVVGPDHFLASGHPDLRQKREEDLPPHLGLIESRDGGETWQRRSLLGEADFHVLRVAGSQVFGYDSTHSRLLRSEDLGSTWAEQAIPAPLFDLALHPSDARQFAVSAEEGLFATDDGGTSWMVLEGPPGLLAWPDVAALYLVDATGAVAVSADGGQSWTPRGRVAGEPAALLAVDATNLFVALHDGAIVRSTDGGATFTDFSRPS